MAEDEQVVQHHVDDGHDDRGQREDPRPGDAHKEGAKHDAGEGEEEAVDAPIEILHRGRAQLVGRDHDAHHSLAPEPRGDEAHRRQREQEEGALKDNGPDGLVASLPVASADDDLRSGAEAEGHGEDADVVQSAHGRSTERHLADAPQEDRVGDGDHVLRQ